jgi:hypothetical protein
MIMNPDARKMRRSFTLSPEAVRFISETRQRCGAKSESEALELLLREAMLEAKRQEIDAACKEYYDRHRLRCLLNSESGRNGMGRTCGVESQGECAGIALTSTR